MAEENNNGGSGGRSLQDIMAGELFASSRGDLVETLRFMEKHGTPLSERQVAAVALLRSLQAQRHHKLYEPIIATATGMAKEITPPNVFIDVIEKMTLGGFVTGKVRLSKVFGGDK
ncbi:hypothetical protein SDD30_08090 [Moorella naiadis]|uniref:hypothetical protein n=1 Tax=Moorella naiadis (nom. illeg.) TaxID=3093670 RepID=UPI003D9CAA50